MGCDRRRGRACAGRSRCAEYTGAGRVRGSCRRGRRHRGAGAGRSPATAAKVAVQCRDGAGVAGSRHGPRDRCRGGLPAAGLAMGCVGLSPALRQLRTARRHLGGRARWSRLSVELPEGRREYLHRLARNASRRLTRRPRPAALRPPRCAGNHSDRAAPGRPDRRRPGCGRGMADVARRVPPAAHELRRRRVGLAGSEHDRFSIAAGRPDPADVRGACAGAVPGFEAHRADRGPPALRRAGHRRRPGTPGRVPTTRGPDGAGAGRGGLPEKHRPPSQPGVAGAVGIRPRAPAGRVRRIGSAGGGRSSAPHTREPRRAGGGIVVGNLAPGAGIRHAGGRPRHSRAGGAAGRSDTDGASVPRYRRRGDGADRRRDPGDTRTRCRALRPRVRRAGAGPGSAGDRGAAVPGLGVHLRVRPDRCRRSTERDRRVSGASRGRPAAALLSGPQ